VAPEGGSSICDVMTPEVLGRALGEAPDPELARIAVARMGDRAEAREFLARPEIIPAAARLLGFSIAASDFFLAHPEELESLADLGARTHAELVAESEGDVGTLGLRAGLRRFRRRASYRVAARDLGGAEVDDVMAELSAVAEACLELAAKEACAGLPGGGDLAVIGMGKLGGAELNYSSDVDVLFVHGGAGGNAHERASSAAATVIAVLTEPTAEGIALRVDPNLRPEGRSGPLSRSLASMAEYYARYAATWERQALLKARPVAGDPALGSRFLEVVEPLVYPDVLPASAIEDIRSSKARIEDQVRSLGKESVEVKRGRGGIRDVEFAVQLLQLVHGRRHPRLRDPNTLRALAALADEGFVRPADAEVLANSYRFLRRLEHRLQMVRDTQTHELPEDRRAFGPLARSMGLRDASHLMEAFDHHTETVRTLHERLFYRPLLDAFAGPAPSAPAYDRTATEELLAGLGFADPPGAYRSLSRVIDPSTRVGKVMGTLFPVIAPALAFAASPDAALVRFERVTSAMRDQEGLADALADRPDAARRLAALVGTSSAFSDAIVNAPRLAAAVLSPPSEQPGLFPLDPLAELVRVAGAYASGELRVPQVGRRLADVAGAVIALALEKDPPPVPVAVIGLGKLGGEELTFASDLDLVFVYEGEGADDFAAASAAAEGVLARVREAGWQADPDLRPEGRSGPLARSMASYLEYWERWGQVWEYQALLHARLVGGDEMLGRRFLSNAADFAFPEALTFEQVAAIRRMRVRMEEERVRPKDARRFHFKLGYGGLADVQWAVELSLMRHGATHPEIRRTNTLDALELLAAARLVEDSVARSLAEGYVFLSEIKNALEIEHRIPAEALPPTPEAQAALARRLGYAHPARHRFLQDYRRVTHRARRAMERVFYDDGAVEP
jgi:[glutamine synthetase] adenylyltransferase / [glutamine synthetase]-adenylyl-L-tyrosine phosphorylase